MHQELSATLMERMGDPVLGALLLAKAAVASERGIELRVGEDTALMESPLAPDDLITLLGNLVENAFDAAAQSRERWVEVAVGVRTGTSSSVSRTRAPAWRRRTGRGSSSRLQHQAARSRPPPRHRAGAGAGGGAAPRGGRHRFGRAGRRLHGPRSAAGDRGAMIRTLVVDDDVRVADVHCAYVERVPGFVTVGKAHTGVEALGGVARLRPDLLLLDFYLPDLSGLEVLRRLREEDHPPVDVIAITAARDVENLRAAIRSGVVHYLVKPFRFAAFEEKLASYASAHARLARMRQADQVEVDRVFGSLRAASRRQPCPRASRKRPCGWWCRRCARTAPASRRARSPSWPGSPGSPRAATWTTSAASAAPS